VQGAALETQCNYTNFSNHTTSARIPPSRIRVLVLSVDGSVLISLICLNSRETGYGYRGRSSQSQGCRRDDSTKRRLLTQVLSFSYFSYAQYKSNRGCGHLITNYSRHQFLYSYTMCVHNFARILPGRPNDGLKTGRNTTSTQRCMVPIRE
jgi:hypothetical protein